MYGGAQGIYRDSKNTAELTEDGAGNERQAYEWLRQACPKAKPNRLVVFLADEELHCERQLFWILDNNSELLSDGIKKLK